MTRLADRLLTDCQPFRLSLVDPEEYDRLVREELSKNGDRQFSQEELQRVMRAARPHLHKGEPVSTEKFDPKDLSGAPIFAADDVGLYASSFPKGTDFTDVVASMAPPFDKFFIEFQGVPNNFGLHAWGTLITTIDDPDEIEQMIEGEPGRARWVLSCDTYLEREKGKPFGPVANHFAGLAEDGTWFRHANGDVWWAGGPVSLTSDPPEEVVKSWGDQVAQLLFPALLTISFMHCKNVELQAKAPPEKLSKKHRKKKGHDLVRYHVLDIDPLRKALEQHRTGIPTELRRALHICRGHFKTFTEDAPLFGRHTGTYFWTPHVKGSKSSGTVMKDYRVGAPVEFGKAYREANESPPDPTRDAPPSKDPDSVGRGLAAHNKTQNQIAEVVRQLGGVPRSPAPQEPDFDLAWKTQDTFYVCEVKSITSKNEERQLRMAIGQVIRYRQKLTAAGHEPVRAVIAAEREPSDPTWGDLLEDEGILLIWPEVAQKRLESIHSIA